MRATCTRLFALWLNGEITLTDPAAANRRAWILVTFPTSQVTRSPVHVPIQTQASRTTATPPT